VNLLNCSKRLEGARDMSNPDTWLGCEAAGAEC